MAQELTVNALAAIVRAGWVVTMNSDCIEYQYGDNGPFYGDWIRIPDEVAGIGKTEGH